MFVFGVHNRKMSSHAYSFRSMPTIPTARIPRDVLVSGEIKVDMTLKKKFSVRIDRLKSLGRFYKSWNINEKILISNITNLYQEISHLVILKNFLKTS